MGRRLHYFSRKQTATLFRKQTATLYKDSAIRNSPMTSGGTGSGIMSLRKILEHSLMNVTKTGAIALTLKRSKRDWKVNTISGLKYQGQNSWITR